MSDNPQLQFISEQIPQFLELIRASRSKNTARSYANALHAYLQISESITSQNAIEKYIEETLINFIEYLHEYSPASERLYLTAFYRFLEFLSAQTDLSINLPSFRLLIRHRARRYGQRLPQFPRTEIEKIINYAINLTKENVDSEIEQLRLLRDKALLLTLADSGLRIHEACNLRRGDMDWNEQRAIIIGKGNQQAVVRFSSRAIHAIKEYLQARSKLDGSSGKPIASLPIFARHDRAAGKKVKPISTTSGRAIVEHHVNIALGEESSNLITPHSFRHYFVTTVLRGSGGNLKLAQELARHKSISVTQRYAHLSDDELDQGYDEIFNQSKT
ncbi:MAG: tyrosine-type recombinase/integrase [Anaerolineales bacterium]